MVLVSSKYPLRNSPRETVPVIWNNLWEDNTVLVSVFRWQLSEISLRSELHVQELNANGPQKFTYFLIYLTKDYKRWIDLKREKWKTENRSYYICSHSLKEEIDTCIFTMQHITSPELSRLITGSVYLLMPCTHFPHPPSPRLWQPPTHSLPLWVQFGGVFFRFHI